MLLTISTTRRPATDLGYLLHKNPAKVQAFNLPFGRAQQAAAWWEELTSRGGEGMVVKPLEFIAKGTQRGDLLQPAVMPPQAAS